jgi:hypothetical protein
MKNLENKLYTSIIAAESIHIFCCALPTLFSILSLLAGMGMIAGMPVIMYQAHEAIHDYEMPIIIFSAILLAFGWIVYGYSRRMDCANEAACANVPCEPRKSRAKKILIVATILFLVNISLYFTIHVHVDHHGH